MYYRDNLNRKLGMSAHFGSFDPTQGGARGPDPNTEPLDSKLWPVRRPKSSNNQYQRVSALQEYSVMREREKDIRDRERSLISTKADKSLKTLNSMLELDPSGLGAAANRNRPYTAPKGFTGNTVHKCASMAQLLKHYNPTPVKLKPKKSILVTACDPSLQKSEQNKHFWSLEARQSTDSMEIGMDENVNANAGMNYRPYSR